MSQRRNPNDENTYGRGDAVIEHWRHRSGKRYEPRQERAIHERINVRPIENDYTRRDRNREDRFAKNRSTSHDNHEKQKESEPKDQENQKKQKKDRPEKASNDENDVLLGDFPYLKNEKAWKKLRLALPSGAGAKYVPSKTSTLTQKDFEDKKRCRFLIVSMNPEWYSTGTETAKLFKPDTFELANKSKFMDAITELGNNIAAAKQFYNPRQIFVLITEFEKAKPCDFNLMVQYTCDKFEHQTIKIDPLHRKPTFSFSNESEQVTNFVKAVGWGMKTYMQKDGERDITELAKDGLDLDTL